MLLVDEYIALPALAGRPPQAVHGQPLAITYSRAYRLTRALLDPGPGRLQVRGRFTRLVDGLQPEDQHVLREQLADPDPKLLTIVDPRPLIRATGAIQNTYALSMLQAETLAVRQRPIEALLTPFRTSKFRSHPPASPNGRAGSGGQQIGSYGHSQRRPKNAVDQGFLAKTQVIAAEGVGFEPTVPGGTTVFETVRFGRSRTPPGCDAAASDGTARVAPLREEGGEQGG